MKKHQHLIRESHSQINLTYAKSRKEVIERDVRNPVVVDPRAAANDQQTVDDIQAVQKDARSPDDIKVDLGSTFEKDRDAPNIFEEIIAESEVLSEPIGVKLALSKALCIDMDDYYSGMLSKEKEFIGYELQLSNNRTYVTQRQNIVSLVCQTCYRLKLDEAIAHRTIFYLDKIMSSNRYSSSRIRLTIAACLSIAMKYDVTEDLQISPRQIMKAIGLSNLSMVNFRNRGEMIALNILGWKICCLPPITFIHYFFANGVLFVNDDIEQFMERNSCKLITATKILSTLKEYAVFFSQLCLDRYEFCHYRPSILSSAIIRVTRQLLSFHPWRRELEILTNFVEKDLIQISCEIIFAYKEEYPEHYHRTVQTMTTYDRNENLQLHEVYLLREGIDQMEIKNE